MTEPDGRTLAFATVAAAAVAALVLVTAVLPAEYGVDPTGIGRLAGFTRLAGADVDAPDTAGGQDADENETRAGVTLFTYRARWPLATHALGAAEGYTAEGATTTVEVPVTAMNVTRFTATLAWTDANATVTGEPTAPDLFEMSVTAPDGTESDVVLGRNREPGGAGTALVTLTLAAPPAAGATRAAEPADARAHFAAGAPDGARGTGTWRVHVTLVDAGDGSGPALPVSGNGDAGNAWNLTLEAESFTLVVESEPGSGVRKDQRSFELAPGEDVEFKLHMREGQNVTYAWRTSGPGVFVDFHGEPDADPSSFESHDKGTFTERADAFTAPFTGRHGWYWRNEGGGPVTITLALEGHYDIVGLV